MKIADAKNSGALAAPAAKRMRRRTYPRQFKSEVIAQCLAPGASVSAIALSHGINANVIRKWLPPRDSRRLATGTAAMLPVTIDSVPPVKRRAPPAPARSRAPIELNLAGATLRLPAGFDAQELRSIVQILAALR